MFTIGDRLRKAREEAGMGQQELAAAMGASRGTVSNYELGAKPPKRPMLLAWAMATGVPLEWLQTGRAPESGGPDQGTPNTRPYQHCLKAVA